MPVDLRDPSFVGSRLLCDAPLASGPGDFLQGSGFGGNVHDRSPCLLIIADGYEIHKGLFSSQEKTGEPKGSP